ncbi:hypothetical protein TNCV_1844221 [Trichonephila clavipes]|nr:hypothetical protein TNCV_1844221 [Trichonephila clavipes]
MQSIGAHLELVPAPLPQDLSNINKLSTKRSDFNGGPPLLGDEPSLDSITINVKSVDDGIWQWILQRQIWKENQQTIPIFAPKWRTGEGNWNK